jgi:hypothetical protein
MLSGNKGIKSFVNSCTDFFKVLAACGKHPAIGGNGLGNAQRLIVSSRLIGRGKHVQT